MFDIAICLKVIHGPNILWIFVIKKKEALNNLRDLFNILSDYFKVLNMLSHLPRPDNKPLSDLLTNSPFPLSGS